MTRRTEWTEAFAIVRVDRCPVTGRGGGGESGPSIRFDTYEVTVKEVVLSAEEAGREVIRLNDLNADAGCRYYWQGTHLFLDGGSFGSTGTRE